MAKRLDLKDVNIYYGSFHAVGRRQLSVQPRSVTAFIGPSGCGKSTVLRSLNRMHEVTPGARVEGSVLLDGEDIYGAGIDPVGVRRTIGMVFQRPNPFPTMSIRDNVVAGLKLQGCRNARTLDDVAERSLRGANLWNEVKDRLGQARRRSFGRSAATPVHRPRDRSAARRAADGRALFGAGPDFDLGDRGSDRRTQDRTTPSSSSPTTCSRPPESATKLRSSTSKRPASQAG